MATRDSFAGMLNGSGYGTGFLGRLASATYHSFKDKVANSLEKSFGGGRIHLAHRLGAEMEALKGPYWHKNEHCVKAFGSALHTLRAAHALAPLHGAALERAVAGLRLPVLRHSFQSSMAVHNAKLKGSALRLSQKIKLLNDRKAWVKEHPQNLAARPLYRKAHARLRGRFVKKHQKLRDIVKGVHVRGRHQAAHMMGGAPLPMALPQGSQARLEALSAPPDPEASGVVLYNYGGKNGGMGANIQGGGIKRKRC